MFAIANGRKALWQWDLNQQLTVAGDCTEVHYLDRGAPSTLTVAVKDGKADIPNILLQKAGRLVVYAYIIDAQDHHTKVCETFGIAPRPKPTEYVYTETEVKTWSDLQSQIGDLANLVTEEKNNLVAAINEAAKSGGTDISLGLTSAAVGQIIKVKAIDESGKPTAWEAANMPSGGGGASYRSWSKVWTLAVAEDIAGFEANNIDLDGKSEIMIVFISDSTASRTMTNGRIYINGVDAGKVLFNSLPLRKDSHSFVIIGRADEGIEYTTMAAKAEYQTYPWQGDVNVVHRMVSGTASSIMQWTAGSTIKITQASATLGQGVTIEIYVR